MQTERVIQGRSIADGDLELIRSLLTEHRQWNRTRLSRELCGRWGWRNDKGRLKDMACRNLFYGFHFIFVCKADSHTHLYKWVGELETGKDVHTVKMRVKNNKNKWEHHTYQATPTRFPLSRQRGP